MTRVPLLAGTRLVVVDAGADDVVLRPPPPGDAIADVAAAVRDALRFPLEGQPLEALAGRGSRATVVVEPPALPIPSAERDPRQAAIASTVDELERALREGVTAREVEDYKSSFVGSFKVGLATNGGIAERLAEVNAALRKHVVPSRLLTVVAGDVK